LAATFLAAGTFLGAVAFLATAFLGAAPTFLAAGDFFVAFGLAATTLGEAATLATLGAAFLATAAFFTGATNREIFIEMN
jgi:hypothetical protein